MLVGNVQVVDSPKQSVSAFERLEFGNDAQDLWRCPAHLAVKLTLKPFPAINEGVRDSASNIKNKVSRGSFTAFFLVQCLEAIGANRLALD